MVCFPQRCDFGSEGPSVRKLLNNDRNEDREGPAGFGSKAERARRFDPETAVRSFALMAVLHKDIETGPGSNPRDFEKYSESTTQIGIVIGAEEGVAVDLVPAANPGQPRLIGTESHQSAEDRS
jgi:hypothetical protein